MIGDQCQQFCRTVQRKQSSLKRLESAARPSDRNRHFKLFSELLAMSSVSHCQLKQMHMSQTPVTGHHHTLSHKYQLLHHMAHHLRETSPPPSFDLHDLTDNHHYCLFFCQIYFPHHWLCKSRDVYSSRNIKKRLPNSGSEIFRCLNAQR